MTAPYPELMPGQVVTVVARTPHGPKITTGRIANRIWGDVRNVGSARRDGFYLVNTSISAWSRNPWEWDTLAHESELRIPAGHPYRDPWKGDPLPSLPGTSDPMLGDDIDANGWYSNARRALEETAA